MVTRRPSSFPRTLFSTQETRETLGTSGEAEGSTATRTGEGMGKGETGIKAQRADPGSVVPVGGRVARREVSRKSRQPRHHKRPAIIPTLSRQKTD